MNKTRVEIAEEEGFFLGLREGFTIAVEARFGSVPAEVVQKVTATADADTLLRWLRAAATAADLAAFRAATGV